MSAFRSLDAFWLPPLLLGAALIALGVLIIRNPPILAYAVASFFIFLGLAVMGLAWKFRGNVSYRRIQSHSASEFDPS